MISDEDRRLAKILWDYNYLHHDVTPADFIFVMCSYNLDVADHASDLFKRSLGEFIVVSGGVAHTGDLLNTGWDAPEAHVFKNRLIELGMNESDIIAEDQATNSGENITRTRALLSNKNITVSSGLIVQKPYMQRRAYAAAMKQWPEIEWHVSSPPLSYEDYISKHDENRLINILVGDTWRMKRYAVLGYQIPQEIPQEVTNSMKKLIDKGYRNHIQ